MVFAAGLTTSFAPIIIAKSTCSIFGLTSYVLSFKLLKDLIGKTIADKLVKYGIYYYLISSLATWFLAYVIVTQGKTELYYNTVYFYLHFLYNGFFVFGLFGLLFKAFENKKISISENYKKYFTQGEKFGKGIGSVKYILPKKK